MAQQKLSDAEKEELVQRVVAECAGVIESFVREGWTPYNLSCGRDRWYFKGGREAWTTSMGHMITFDLETEKLIAENFGPPKFIPYTPQS